MPWPKGRTKREKSLIIRISEAEMSEYRRAADLLRLPLSAYVRMVMGRDAQAVIAAGEQQPERGRRK